MPPLTSDVQWRFSWPHQTNFILIAKNHFLVLRLFQFTIDNICVRFFSVRTQVAVQRAARSTIDFRLRVQHIHTYSWSVQQQATKRTSECHSKRIDKNLYYVCISFVFARGARRGRAYSRYTASRSRKIYIVHAKTVCVLLPATYANQWNQAVVDPTGIYSGRSRRRTLNGSQSRIKYSGVHVCQLLHYLTHVWMHVSPLYHPKTKEL